MSSWDWTQLGGAHHYAALYRDGQQIRVYLDGARCHALDDAGKCWNAGDACGSQCPKDEA